MNGCKYTAAQLRDLADGRAAMLRDGGLSKRVRAMMEVRRENFLPPASIERALSAGESADLEASRTAMMRDGGLLRRLTEVISRHGRRV